MNPRITKTLLAVGLSTVLISGIAVVNAQTSPDDTIVVQPPPVTFSSVITPPPMTIPRPSPTTVTATSTTTVTAPPPTTTPPPPPTTTPPPPPPPATCTQTAAAKFNWGTPNTADDFNAKPASPRWNVYGPYPGHAGNGMWTPNAVSAKDGIMTIVGNAQGETGGMAMSPSQFRGRWEVCVKSAPGSAQYSPVTLLWASSSGGVNSSGGEVDFMEITPPNASRQRVNFFLHWPNSTGRSSSGINIDATQWHSWAVEWTSTAIVGYVDGVEWFRDSNPTHLPNRNAALCLQLSNLGGDISAGGRMDFDWVRQYSVT